MRYDVIYLFVQKWVVFRQKFFLCLVFKKKMCHGKQPFVKEFFFHPLTSINLNLYLGISHPPHITRLSYRYFLLLSFNFAFSSSCHGSCMWILCVLVMMEI